MKKTTSIIALAFISSAGVFAQTIMTNAIQRELTTGSPSRDLTSTMQDISDAFNVRICSESHMSRYILPNPEIFHLSRGREFPITFKNATLDEVFGTIMRNDTTNHTWRYESKTDTIFVYPETNAISMMRCGPIYVTNMLARAFFDEHDILGFNGLSVRLLVNRFDEVYWSEQIGISNISLEFENAYVWQVLDAIEKQLPFAKSWHIYENNPLYEQNRFNLIFYRNRNMYNLNSR